MVKDLLAAPLPVIVYVAPSGASAASAGMFMTDAANLAAMAPGTTIGAAHPIEKGGEEKGVMGHQDRELTATFARSIAHSAAATKIGSSTRCVKDRDRRARGAGQNVVDIVARDIRSLLTQASGRKVQVAGKTVTLALPTRPAPRADDARSN